MRQARTPPKLEQPRPCSQLVAVSSPIEATLPGQRRAALIESKPDRDDGPAIPLEPGQIDAP